MPKGRLLPPQACWLLPIALLCGAPVARAGGAATDAGSLAPLQPEWVRERYGQESLFRLRLGVDAARDEGRICPPERPSWSGSDEQRRLEQELAAGRPYAAGLVLGAWRLQQLRCWTGGAATAPHGSAQQPQPLR